MFLHQLSRKEKIRLARHMRRNHHTVEFIAKQLGLGLSTVHKYTNTYPLDQPYETLLDNNDTCSKDLWNTIKSTTQERRA